MRMWARVLLGLSLGVVVGWIIGNQSYFAAQTIIRLLDQVGKAFINLLRMVVGLVVSSCLIVGVCHIGDPKKLRRIGARTVLFYAITTCAAISFGLLLAFLVRPGQGLNLPLPPPTSSPPRPAGLLTFLFSIIPANPLRALIEGNVLQVIFFSLFFAMAITLSGDKGKAVLSFFEAIKEIMNSLTQFIMKLAPYGIFALMATAVNSIGFKIILPLILVLLCNYAACILQVLLVFCLTLRYITKLQIFPFFRGMREAIVLAFTTSSSSATLPISLKCVRTHLGISSDMAGFVLSLGSTINMNGTAIGQVIFSLFIAQAYGIEMSCIKIVILSLVSFISAVGATGIPGAGLLVLSIVLNTVGLPLEGIALIAGIDRLREMVSTVVNILGDGVAAVLVAKKENHIDLQRYCNITK